jgi:folate-binding protein YgfZ
MPSTTLAGRAVVTVTGKDAETLLQGIVTTDLDTLGDDEARPGALLTPQGKILCDFLVSRLPDGLRLEVAEAAADDLARRLMLYRMRAKAEISVHKEVLVATSWGTDSSRPGPRDSRFPEALGVRRHYDEPLPDADAPLEAWTALRIAHGVAEAGADYALGDAFPHDVNLDQTGGVSFKKGCFIGQEVVSRMQHRGTARRRVLVAKGGADLPAAGTAIEAGGREIGTLGSVAGNSGLALVRIDRVEAARDQGVPITADAVVLDLGIPPEAAFTWPQAAATDES